MGNQGNIRVAQGVVAAALEGGDENDIGLHAHHHLGVEIAFDTYLHRAALSQLAVHGGVEEIARAGDARHERTGIQSNEVGELERGHADNAANGRLYRGIVLGNAGRMRAAGHKGKVIARCFGVLRVVHIQQAHAVCTIVYGIALGIGGSHL